MPRHAPIAPVIDGLNPDDPGIALLGRAVAGEPAREILLICSGDLPGVGAEATRLVLDARELAGARARAVPFSLDPLPEPRPQVGHAVVWPRPHLGKDFSFACLAYGGLALRPGGSLWCATRKAKGARSIADEMVSLMGEVEVIDRDRGYRLLRAHKTEAFDEARARMRMSERYAIEDPLLPGLSLQSSPGVFSRKELDAGTRQLIMHAAARELSPRVVLDLGCGVGPLALWAATRWPRARVLAVDSNLLAVGLARRNKAQHGLGDRITVLAGDGLPDEPAPAVAELRGEVELALVNPPTHAEPSTLGRFSQQLAQWLAPRGRALLVVSRAGRMSEQLRSAGAQVQAHAADRYTILEARWGGEG